MEDLKDEGHSKDGKHGTWTEHPIYVKDFSTLQNYEWYAVDIGDVLAEHRSAQSWRKIQSSADDGRSHLAPPTLGYWRSGQLLRCERKTSVFPLTGNYVSSNMFEEPKGFH